MTNLEAVLTLLDRPEPLSNDERIFVLTNVPPDLRFVNRETYDLERGFMAECIRERFSL